MPNYFFNNMSSLNVCKYIWESCKLCVLVTASKLLTFKNVLF